MNDITTQTDSKWIDIFLLTLFLIFIHFLFLGKVSLFVPDEARYAEIAREIVTSHQWFIPHLDGIIYVEKPPLSYWLNALCLEIFGQGEWSARSMGAFLSTLLCLATYYTANMFYNRRIAIFSTLILSSSALFFIMSHMTTVDMTLTFFLSSSLYAFLLGLQKSIDSSRNKWLYLAYIMAGLAMMTKGLIGIVFPGLILFTWILFTKQWQLVKQLNLLNGTMLIIALNVPWLIFVQHQLPDFFNFYFIEQQVARYATPIANREMHILNYCLIFLLGLYPWVIFLPQSILQILPHKWTDRTKHKIELYFLIWPVVIFLFFAKSHSILAPYLLPVVPPIAILIALYLDSIYAKTITKNNQRSLIIFMVINFVVAVTFILLAYFNVIEKPRSFLSFTLKILPLFLGIVLVGYGLKRWSMKQILITLLIATYIFYESLWFYAEEANIATIKPLALKINQLLKSDPQAIVINYGDYHQDLPYYINRLVPIVNWTNELSFGAKHQDISQPWLLDDTHFWQLWRSKQNVYVILRSHLYDTVCQQAQPQCHFIAKTTANTLISNNAALDPMEPPPTD